MNIEQALIQLLQKSVEKTRALKALRLTGQISLETPKDKRFGDFSSSIALALGRKINRAPLELAQELKQVLEGQLKQSKLKAEVKRVEIKGPGFINFFLSQACLYQTLVAIRKQNRRFGCNTAGKGKKVLIEFVSANPTGPLTVAHGRQAALGDSLGNVLEFSGYKVAREYYLNDEGVQINILGNCLRVKYLRLLGIEEQFPEAGYQGKYIDDLAQMFFKKYARRFAKDGSKNLGFFSDFAVNKILAGIKNDLKQFSVEFDSWFSQKKLSRQGKVKRALDALRENNFLYQKEGAWWLKTAQFGDDKDRVVIKSDSSLTYIAPDIAYHQNKYKRGFSRIINIWGPDHHGYIARLKAAVSALGYNPEILTVLTAQLVSLSSADKIIPMSTRLGQFVSLHDILAAIGKDAGRFFFLMRKRDSHLQFDLELAKKKTLENPVFYIQYAHARIISIIKRAAEKGLKPRGQVQLTLLDQPEELILIQTLGKFPEVVDNCAAHLEPHRITVYLQALARDFHHYYEKHKVVTEDKDLSRARLALVDAAGTVFRSGLRLLAVSSPEKM